MSAAPYPIYLLTNYSLSQAGSLLFRAGVGGWFYSGLRLVSVQPLGAELGNIIDSVVTATGQLMITLTLSLIALVEKTNFPLFTILIQLKTADSTMASYS